MKRILLLCLILMLSACTNTEYEYIDGVNQAQAICQNKDIRVMLLPATIIETTGAGTTDEVSCTKYKLFLGNEYMGEYDADKYLPVNATVELNLSNGTQYNKTILANYGEQYDALVYKDTKCNGTKVYGEKISFVVPCASVYKVTPRLMKATPEHIFGIWQEHKLTENVIYATPGETEHFGIERSTAPGGTQFSYIACDWDRKEIEYIETQKGDYINPRQKYHDGTWKIYDDTLNIVPFIVTPRYDFNGTKITCYLQDEDYYVVPALYPYVERGIYDYYFADVGMPNQRIDIEVRKR